MLGAIRASWDTRGVDESPLSKPAHLSDVPTSRGTWLATRPFALVAFALGIVTFIIALVIAEPLWSTPDMRVTVPGFIATVVAGLVSIARRERAWPLWLAGFGMAAAALVLGWFLMVAIVIGATAILILILNTVM